MNAIYFLKICHIYFYCIIICGFVETLLHPIYSDTTLTFSLKYTLCPSDNSLVRIVIKNI